MPGLYGACVEGAAVGGAFFFVPATFDPFRFIGAHTINKVELTNDFSLFLFVLLRGAVADDRKTSAVHT
jgi:hypothetical protein